MTEPMMTDKLEARLGRRALLAGLGGGALLLLGGSAVWLGSRRRPTLRASRRVMGTRATLLVHHASPATAEAAMDAAFAALDDVARRMTRYDAASEIGRLNAQRGRWWPVSADTDMVLAAALTVARATDGCFDPCVERIVSAWGFHTHTPPATLPLPLRPTGASTATGAYRGLASRPAEGGARLWRLPADNPGLDLGGIAKGHAIDRAVAALRRAGVTQALVNVGDDIHALGQAPDGGPWRIGVRHPRRPGALLTTLRLREQAVATSGDYMNFFERDGRRYSHLIDPRVGAPGEAQQSTSVVADSAMLADALATAAGAAPWPRAQALLRRVAPGPWVAVTAGGTLHRG